jgi:hypothetical protein
MKKLKLDTKWAHKAVILLLAAGTGCSSESGGKTYKVVTNETVANTDGSTIVDDGKNNELFEAKDFKLTFESPSADQVKIGVEGLTVGIKPWNAPPTATWGLFYTTAFKDLTTAKPIFEGLPISVLEVTWNTSSMKSGEYFLFAEAKAGSSRSLYWLATKVTITIDAATGAPQVIISTPTDKQVFNDGDTLKFDYNAVTTEGASLLFNVFVSPDNGATWQQLETATNKKSTTVTFDATTFTQSARYKFKVEADNGQMLGALESEGNFGYSAKPVTFDAEVKAITDAKCATAGCHDGTRNNKGDFNAKTYNDLNNNIGSFKGINSSKEQIFSRTRADNDMPPAGAPQLNQAEKDLIALWSWGGYVKTPVP